MERALFAFLGKFGLGQRSGNTGQHFPVVAALLGRRSRTVQRIANLVETVLEEVPVGVQGHGGGGVAEHLLDDLHIRPGRDREAGGGVPQLVRVQIGDADGLGGDPELQAEGADPQGCTVADAGKHQVMGFSEAYMCSELLDEEQRDRDLTTLVALRGAPDHALAAQRGHGLRDDRSLPAQVEARDPKSGHLAEPGAGVGQEQHDKPIHLVGAGVIAAVLAGLGRVAARSSQVVDLVVGEVQVLVLDDARQVHASGDVAGEPPVLDRHVEDQAEHPVDLLHGGGGLLLGQGGHPDLHVGVRDVGELHGPPFRPDVLAQDPGVPLVRRRLEVRLPVEPPIRPVADRDLRQGRVDVGPGRL